MCARAIPLPERMLWEWGTPQASATTLQVPGLRRSRISWLEHLQLQLQVQQVVFLYKHANGQILQPALDRLTSLTLLSHIATRRRS